MLGAHVHVRVHYDGTHADASKDGKTVRLTYFSREIAVEGDLDDAQCQRLLEIADRCPVHRSLEAGAVIATRMKGYEASPAA